MVGRDGYACNLGALARYARACNGTTRMRLFDCQYCGQMLYFENTQCESCGHRLGYSPDRSELFAVESQGDHFRALGSPGNRWRFCRNADYDVCNWLLDAESPEHFCLACRHNRVIPDLSVPGNMRGWRKMEFAEHRLFYSLARLGLPMPNRVDDPKRGLAFDLLAESPDPTAPRVMTGHDEGLVTVALAEADDAERERRRAQMGEPYRTLLGHFRHEVGHYFWNELVRDGGQLAACRAVFGDDRADYGEALKRHYAQGAPPDWQDRFVSAYASSHPWEDFAETWSHYLHIVDTLDTAAAFGLEVNPQITRMSGLHARITLDSYAPGPFEPLLDTWLPLTFALNSLNRSIGQADAYPFILSVPVVRKLAFIHDLVHGQLPPS